MRCLWSCCATEDVACVASRPIGEGDAATCNLGAALLSFFTDLALITRKTPAPCPWCGGETFVEESTGMVFCKSLTCCFSGTHGVGEFNRVAVPLAFERAKGGG